MPSPKITLSLLGHILNDHWLTGTVGLEGQQFFKVIEYMNHYIQSAEHDPKLKTFLDQNASIKKLTESYTQLTDDASKLDDLNATLSVDYHDAIARLKMLCIDFSQRIQNLKHGEALLLPGGWSNVDGGHAMLYQFLRAGDNHIEFIIYNTGAGIRFHPRRTTEAHDVYSPVLTYRIDSSTIDESKLTHALNKILSAQCPALHNGYSAESLYALFPLFLGELIYAPDQLPLSSHTAGQVSGTCTQRVINHLIKVLLPLETYHQFMFEFANYAIKDAFNTFENEGLLSKPAYIKQLRKAIHRQFKIISKHPQTDVANHEETIQILTGYAEKLRPFVNQQKRIPPIASPDEGLSDHLKVEDESICIPDITPPAIMSGLKKPPPLPQSSPQKQFTDIRQQIEELKIIKNSVISNIEWFAHLEAFFLNVPLPDSLKDDSFSQSLSLLSVYRSIRSRDDLNKLCIDLIQLQSDYFRIAKQLIGDDKATPQMFIVKLSIFSLLAYLEVKTKPSEKKYYYQYVAKRLANIGQLQYSPFLSLHNPSELERYKQTTTLLLSIQQLNNESIINYYQYDFFNSCPDAKKALEKAFDDDDKCNNPYDAEIREIIRNQYQALYYLTQHTSESRHYIGNYAEPINALQTQTNLEGCYATGIPSLLLTNNTQDPTKKLSITIYARKSNLEDPNSRLETFYCSPFPATAEKNTLSIQNPIIKAFLPPSVTIQSALITALSEPSEKRSDNHIQLYSASNSNNKSNAITHEDVVNRQYFHLRCDPKTQFMLTLEHFRANLDKLKIPGIFSYIEGNLFSIAILNHFQTGSPQQQANHLEIFQLFITEALTCYTQQGRLTVPALGCIRLAYYFYSYLFKANIAQMASTSDSNIFHNPLKEFYNQLSKWIDIQQTPSIAASLHRYRLMTGMDLSDNTFSMNELLPSYFFAKAVTPADEWSPTHNNEFEKITARFTRHLLTRSHEITKELISQLFRTLDIDLPSSIDIIFYRGRINIFNALEPFAPYQLDLPHGHILHNNGLTFKSTPPSVLNHPVITHCHLSNSPLTANCYQSSDDVILELPERKLQFIVNPNHKNGDQSEYNVYCSFNEFGDNEYQLMGSSSEQAKRLSIQSELKTPLPAIFKESSLLTWVDTKKTTTQRTIIITDTNLTPRYKLSAISQPTANGEYQLEDLKEKLYVCTYKTRFHERLAHFENPAFILVEGHTPYSVKPFKDLSINDSLAAEPQPDSLLATQAASTISTIQLPRFGITLSTNESALYYLHQGIKYVIELNDASDMATFNSDVAHLIGSHDGQQICIVAVSQFITDQQQDPEHEYYHFMHDTSDIIRQEVIKKEKTNEDPTQHYTPFVQYTGSKNVMIFNLDNNGRPIPRNPEEALYLAYIYLAIHQPERAWEVLEICQHQLGGLIGTEAEICFINWMMSALPYYLRSGDATAARFTPDICCCQLKALSLLARFERRAQSITFSSIPFSPNTDDYLYAEFAQKQTKLFYFDLVQVIQNQYEEYQKIERSTSPARLPLSFQEHFDLLDYYHKKSPIKAAIGAIGYAWIKLKLSLIQKEMHTLTTLQQNRVATPYETKRLRMLQNYENHQTYTRESKLVKKNINLDLPSALPCLGYVDDGAAVISSLENSAITPDLRNRNYFYIVSHTTKFPEFPLDNPETFIKNFPYYAHYIFQRPFDPAPHREELLLFAKRNILANRLCPLAQQNSRIPFLCIILYRLYYLKDNVEISKIFNSIIPTTGHAEDKNTILQLINRLANILSTLPASETVPKDAVLEAFALVDTTDRVFKSPEDILKHLPPLSIAQPVLTPEEQKNFNNELSRTVESYIPFVEKPSMPKLDQGIDLSEEKVGKVKFTYLQQLKGIALKEFNSPSDAFRTHITEKTQAFGLLCNQDKQNDILKFCHDHRHDEKKPTYELEVMAELKAPLNFKRLLNLYFTNDLIEYEQVTALSPENCKEVHKQLTLFLANALEHQRCLRIQKKLDVLNSPHLIDKEQACYELAQAVWAINQVDLIDDPALTIFQYHANLLLQPEQKAAIDRLLKSPNDEGFEEIVERLLMGGGKSTILLPTLAKKKATGNNLVMIEVPPALLRVNYTELLQTTESLFGQSAYLLEFNRNTDDSVEHLTALFEDLTRVMLNKEYVVTTGNALQSIQLKYIELLSKKPLPQSESGSNNTKALKKWAQQIAQLENILSLFKNRGDLIIDEVHLGLLLKNKLNYSMGESISLGQHPAIIAHSIALFKFLKHIQLSQDNMEGLNQDITAESLITNAHILSEPQYHHLSNLLATALVKHENSPLKRFSNSISVQLNDALINYLQNKGTEIPDFIQNATPDIKDQIALYKQQFTYLLPYTLRRNLCEHYGPSHDLKKPIEERLIAVPYSANNVPIESSAFADPIETLLFTTQSLIIQGIPKTLLCQFIKTLQLKAQRELLETSVTSIHETPTGKLLLTLFSNIKELLNQRLEGEDSLESQPLFDEIYKQCHKHKPTIYVILEKYILPKIQVDAFILQSDAYNHVSMVRSCQGITGTPTPTTMPKRLHFDDRASFGQDNYMIECIHNKTPQVRPLNYANAEAFIKEALAPYQPDDCLRALIDINATFKNTNADTPLNNQEIAIIIGRYIKENPAKLSDHKLKYILFFNEDNELVAFNINQNSQENPFILITGSQIQLKPEECFTYYDQAHAVGTNILQEPIARAIVTLDEKTPLSSALQGMTRMRGLVEGKQSIDILVPDATRVTTFEQLCEKLKQFENERLKKDNFEAARLRMRDVIHHFWMTYLLHSKTPIEKKADDFQKIASHFIENQDIAPFNKYGDLLLEEKTELVLTQFQEELLIHWESLAQQFEDIQSELPQFKASLTKTLNEIRETALKPGLCLENQQKRTSMMPGTEVSVQKNIQTTANLNLQQESHLDTYNELSNESHTACNFKHWQEQSAPPEPMTLLLLCQTTGASNIPDFDPGIQMSINFYQTYNGQRQYLNKLLKPVHTLLFRQDPHTKELTCTLLTQEESKWLAKSFKSQYKTQYRKKTNYYPDINGERDYEYIRNGETFDYWISTTQHHCISGNMPENIQHNPKYRNIIEQIRYFNGDFELSIRDQMLSWLKIDTDKKLNFYNQYIAQSREATPESLNQVLTLLSQASKNYATLLREFSSHPEHIDLDTIFPNLEPTACDNLKKMQAALEKIERDWVFQAIETDGYTESLEIPFMALGEITSFIKEKIEEKEAMSKFNDNQFKSKLRPEVPHLIAMSILPPGTVIKKNLMLLIESTIKIPNQNQRPLQDLFDIILGYDLTSEELDKILNSDLCKAGEPFKYKDRSNVWQYADITSRIKRIIAIYSSHSPLKNDALIEKLCNHPDFKTIDDKTIFALAEKLDFDNYLKFREHHAAFKTEKVIKTMFPKIKTTEQLEQLLNDVNSADLLIKLIEFNIEKRAFLTHLLAHSKFAELNNTELLSLVDIVPEAYYASLINHPHVDEAILLKLITKISEPHGLIEILNKKPESEQITSSIIARRLEINPQDNDAKNDDVINVIKNTSSKDFLTNCLSQLEGNLGTNLENNLETKLYDNTFSPIIPINNKQMIQALVQKLIMMAQQPTEQDKLDKILKRMSKIIINAIFIEQKSDDDVNIYITRISKNIDETPNMSIATFKKFIENAHKAKQNLTCETVRAINEEIERLEKYNGFFDFRTKTKADKIKATLKNVPLENREKILFPSNSELEAVAVIVALSMHRNPLTQLFHAICEWLGFNGYKAQAYKNANEAIHDVTQYQSTALDPLGIQSILNPKEAEMNAHLQPRSNKGGAALPSAGAAQGS